MHVCCSHSAAYIATSPVAERVKKSDCGGELGRHTLDSELEHNKKFFIVTNHEMENKLRCNGLRSHQENQNNKLVKNEETCHSCLFDIRQH